MPAHCQTCDFYEPEGSEPHYNCSRCQRILANYSEELIEWIRGVVSRAILSHERDNKHEASDYWD